jgi:hypothetical protein
VNRFIQNLPAAKYHADDIGETAPSLSSSIASVMIEKSPWHAHRYHPRLGNVQRKSTESQKLGTVLHALLLGDTDDLAILDVKEFRTDADKALRDNAIAFGKTPVKRAEYNAALEHAAHIDNALRKQYGIELGSMQRELTAAWNDNGTICRARFDAFDGETIWDLKTCADASPQKLDRRVIDYGYHVQGAGYVSGAEHALPHMAGRIKFGMLFIENETNAVVKVDLCGTFRELGLLRWEQAVLSWRKCLETGNWPGYAGKEGVTLDCPEWYRTKNDSELFQLRERTGAYV